VIFSRPLWLLGAAFSLESLRRGFVGGSALSLFIIKEFGLDKQAAPTLKFMRSYLATEEVLLTQIPDYLAFLVTPFQDYHDAATAFLEIVDGLAQKQRPPTCEYYWEKGET